MANQFPNLSLKESQMIISQVLHDLISSFSAVSAGIDFLQTESFSQEICELAKNSRDQMTRRISLFRTLFSYSAQEGNEELQSLFDYLSHQDVLFEPESLIKLPQTSQMIAVLIFWLIGQRIQKKGCLRVLFSDHHVHIVFSETLFSSVSEEDAILLGQSHAVSARYSYSLYTRHLLEQQQQKIGLERTKNTIRLTLFETNK